MKKPTVVRGFDVDELEDCVDKLLLDPDIIEIWIRDGSNSGQPLPKNLYDWSEVLDACYRHETTKFPSYADAATLTLGWGFLAAGLVATGGAGIIAGFGIASALGGGSLSTYQFVQIASKDARAIERTAVIRRAMDIVKFYQI